MKYMGLINSVSYFGNLIKPHLMIYVTVWELYIQMLQQCSTKSDLQYIQLLLQ